MLVAAHTLSAQQAHSTPPASAEEVAARATQAKGGLAKLESITGFRGTYHVVRHDPNGAIFEFDEIHEFKAPNLLRVERRTPKGVLLIHLFDGDKVWSAEVGKGAATELTSAASFFKMPILEHVGGEYVDPAKLGSHFEWRGKQTSNGHDCYGIITTSRDEHLYRCFDANTFLDIEVRDDQSTMVRSDFRPVDGVLFPFHLERSSAQGTMVLAATRIELNPGFDKNEFRKPSPIKADNAMAAVASVGVTADQVRAARKQITEAIQQVRTCPALPFVPACSFATQPTGVNFTHRRIEFWAPINKEWGGPRSAFIDLDKLPELKPRPNDTWRLLNPEHQFQTVNPVARNFEKSGSNILYDRPRLEWPIKSPFPERFLQALEILKADAKAPVGADEQEQATFHQRVLAWRALSEKPALPDAVHREEVLAKNSIQVDQNPEVALGHFEKGLSIESLWPAGQLGAATICGELQRYVCAVQHAERFLDMLPDAPQAETLRDKLIIWKDKLGKE